MSNLAISLDLGREEAMLSSIQEPSFALLEETQNDSDMERNLFRRELQMARAIQDSLLPKRFPELGDFEIAGFCRSARDVGGDFFDVIPLADQSALLVIADVMGKGVPAALLAATLRTLLRTMAQWTARPGELLARINRTMFPELSSVDMFITVQLLSVDAERRTMTIANAGHCPLLVSQGASVDALAAQGLPLGVMEEAVYPETVIALDTLALAVLYTDGITDVRNRAGECFGLERVKEWMIGARCAASSAEDLKLSFLSDCTHFSAGEVVRDDQTVLIFKRKASPPAALVQSTVIQMTEWERQLPLSETQAGLQTVTAAIIEPDEPLRLTTGELTTSDKGALILPTTLPEPASPQAA